MKRIFVLLLLLAFSLPVFAGYKPIPKEFSKQYKTEITQLINTQYPIAVHQTEQKRRESHDFYLKVLKNKNLYIDYATRNYDMTISNSEFEILSQIVDITNKYVNIKDDEELSTGFTGSLMDFLDPYFKDNKIDINKLKSLSALIHIRYNEIIQEQEALHRFIYPEEY